MQSDVPKCYSRMCKHFIGIMPSEADKDVYICKAFPEDPGIPEDIVFRDNLHTKKVKGDHGIRYEKEE